MARAPITIEVKDTSGNAVAGASVNITSRATGIAATLYSLETGPSTVTNPLTTDARGRASCWADRGGYNLAVSGSGLTPYTIAYDNAAASDKSIDAAWDNQGVSVPRVSSLPSTSLVDGMEVMYAADSTNGIYWHLKYNSGSGSAYKWEFIGGSPLFNAVDTAQSTSSVSEADLTTNGPILTMPLAGDYDFEWFCYANAGSAVTAVTVLSINGAASAAGDRSQGTVPGVSMVTALAMATRKTGLAAGNTARVRYFVSSAISTTFTNRKLLARPIRVG